MSTWGDAINVSIFGESHGQAIGVVIAGLPAGEVISWPAVLSQMARRAPGQDPTATPRREADTPQLLAGSIPQGDDAFVTTGAPLAMAIHNTNTRSQDYGEKMTVPRPGHADYPAFVKYHGASDHRGGGHFSGRLTAPIVFAGAVCRQILARKGIAIAAHALQIGQAKDQPFPRCAINDALMQDLSSRYFATIDPQAQNAMRQEIAAAHEQLDSIGGIIECACTGLPPGIAGEGIFGGIESALAPMIFAIPACKGLDFGAGFDVATLRGSQNNDAYFYDGDQVKSRTNHAGGSLGGISTGMPLLFRAAFKPTPSIAREQPSVDLQQHVDTTLNLRGRHDPCIVPRAIPVVEAMTAIAILNLLHVSNA